MIPHDSEYTPLTVAPCSVMTLGAATSPATINPSCRPRRGDAIINRRNRHAIIRTRSGGRFEGTKPCFNLK